uniref:Uncharacterized protein n=1 Tax=Herelleviridae sp. cttEB8 TaxID=2825832 RepID=A0A8S5P5E8_9CAUD|nr:MAG TPA: hypothetical protein [Herelleviridae sp. cttEB8]DAP16129.1 MAG TPA: hypothetical protein [Bacteriophage sp.]
MLKDLIQLLSKWCNFLLELLDHINKRCIFRY